MCVLVRGHSYSPLHPYNKGRKIKGNRVLQNLRENFGLSASIEKEFQEHDSVYQLARVIGIQGTQYQLQFETEVKKGACSGRLEYTAIHRSDFPTIGDWVLARVPDTEGPAIIDKVLERESFLSRKQAGNTSDEQLIACNVDFVFIVQSCNQDLNIRRLERYLIACKTGKVTPVLIFSKSDLPADQARIGEKVRSVSEDLEFHFVSIVDKTNLDIFEPYLAAGKTALFAGSSGVGKSSLTNELCPEAEQKIKNIRKGDDKGLHTTTDRKMFTSKYGGLIVDTPGMREFGLLSTGHDIDESFQDILELADQCQFRNCNHGSEPGCKIQEAIALGKLDPARLKSYEKLQRENAYEKRRQDAKEQANSKKVWKNISKQVKQFKKMKLR